MQVPELARQRLRQRALPQAVSQAGVRAQQLPPGVLPREQRLPTSMISFFFCHAFSDPHRPTRSRVQVDAEADAGTPQIHRAAVDVGEPEAQVAQRDGTPDVYQVVVVRGRLHDVPHALAADDLGDDVVAQRPDRVRRVRQRGAAKVELVVGVHDDEAEDLRGAFPAGG